VPREVILRVVPLLLLAASAVAAPPLKVDLDKSRVDLAARKLELRMNKAPARVDLKVFGASGDAPLLEHSQDLAGHAAGETMTVTWPDPGGAVTRLDLRAYDTDGLWVGFALTPWSVNIPHEEVNFATDSAVITRTEAPKLEASLELINKELARAQRQNPGLHPSLYIAGHTDTVGNAAYNLKLSQRRAQAIAGWFRKRGVRIPVLFEGFGEASLAVSTPDQTDEARNRRVDYILGDGQPGLKPAAWKRVP
jgi:outer membrane protein OmpA-like peptidoglycan-associated protein